MKIKVSFELNLSDLEDWMNRELTGVEVSLIEKYFKEDYPTKAFYDLREFARNFEE